MWACPMSDRPSVEELRAAADVIDRHAEIYKITASVETDWCDDCGEPLVWRSVACQPFSENLRAHADRIEAEEAVAKAEEQLIEDIARTFRHGTWTVSRHAPWTDMSATYQETYQERYRDGARALLAEFTITRREDT